MSALLECDVPLIEEAARTDLEKFFKSVSQADQCALALDFDGTLAPFRVDPSTVRPWSGIAKLLESIRAEGRTRIAIVSGRPALQVKSQLGMVDPVEIWGLHGSEHILPGGQLELEELLPHQSKILEQAREAIQKARLGVRYEDKWNAVVLHWRGSPPHAAITKYHRSLALLSPFVGSGISLLQFDGGVELRAGRNKGDAVRVLIKGIGRNAPIAYLGDDTTDEDAFQALANRGLGVLVRREWRPGAAHLWLRPPHELRNFLRRWLNACSAH